MEFSRWWRSHRASRKARAEREPRLCEARRYGHALARRWLAGPRSAVRSLTPGVDHSLVAVAFRHGLIEGASLSDAAEVAQAVLAGMTEAGRSRARRAPLRAGHTSHEASRRATAERGVIWMADRVLRGVEDDHRLSRATIEKIRAWSRDLQAPRPVAIDAVSTRHA
jgi:hypothetical protein